VMTAPLGKVILKCRMPRYCLLSLSSPK
jgi:hypothetical protein